MASAADLTRPLLLAADARSTALPWLGLRAIGVTAFVLRCGRHAIGLTWRSSVAA